MMDLRWGIREQSRNDHTIIEFCLREIDKCRTKSIGPNFVVSGVRLCVFLYHECGVSLCNSLLFQRVLISRCENTVGVVSFGNKI